MEKDAKTVYEVPWETNTDKNAFNDVGKYGFAPHPETGTINYEGQKTDIVIFKPVTVEKDGLMMKKLLEILEQKDVYEYFKTHVGANIKRSLLKDLNMRGINWRGIGDNKKLRVWGKGMEFLRKTWYAYIDYREKPTIITIKSMLLPFVEFANSEIVELCLPEVKEWEKEGKVRIESADIIKERLAKNVFDRKEEGTPADEERYIAKA